MNHLPHYTTLKLVLVSVSISVNRNVANLLEGFGGVF